MQLHPFPEVGLTLFIIGAAEYEFECAHQTVDKDRAMAGSLSLLLVLFAVSVALGAPQSEPTGKK